MVQETKATEGYQVDESLANGPLAKRGCNDILCCLLFLANIGIIVGIGAYGFSKGHPDRLLVPYDSDGRACGKDTAVVDYPYVFLPAPRMLTRSICLKTCPSDSIDNTPSITKSENAAARAQWNRLEYAATPSAYDPILSKVENVSTFLTETPANQQSPKIVAVYQTKGFFGRVCLPYGPDAANLLNQVGSALGEGTSSLEKYMSDLKTAWATILGSVGIAFVVAMLYMVLLRYFSGLLTWLSIIAYFACLLALAALILNKGEDKVTEGLATNDSSMQTDGKSLKVVSYVVFAFAGLCAIVILCLFNQIRQAIAIIKSAALFVAEVKSVFFVPPVFTFANMLFMAWWIIAFVFVYSVGDIQGSDKGPFASVVWAKNTRYMLAYHIFGGLWINAFFGALIQFVLATACALWYFNKPNEPHRPVYTGIVRGMTNHFGSLAFGALLLAIVQFIRLVLEYVAKQLKASGQSQNKVVKYLIDCLRCYMDCFERFIKFLNKNAYIQIAITGKNFCLAAKDAFWLIWTNPAKFGVIAAIGGVFIFIGRIFIACVTGLITYIILTRTSYYQENLFSPILPTAFCVLFGYFIGTFFMSVYGMGIDTILQCSCLDEELMKKTGKDPDRCPGPLKEFFAGRGHK